jgi:signal peptidase I
MYLSARPFASEDAPFESTPLKAAPLESAPAERNTPPLKELPLSPLAISQVSKPQAPLVISLPTHAAPVQTSSEIPQVAQTPVQPVYEASAQPPVPTTVAIKPMAVAVGTTAGMAAAKAAAGVAEDPAAATMVATVGPAVAATVEPAAAARTVVEPAATVAAAPVVTIVEPAATATTTAAAGPAAATTTTAAAVAPVAQQTTTEVPIPIPTATRRTRTSARRQARAETKTVFLVALRDVFIALALLTILLQFFSPTVVREHSMENTLNENEMLYIAKKAYWFGPPQHGDIVVFHTTLTDQSGTEKNLVKRIIGLPGDRISISGGMVIRNDEVLDEPYLKAEGVSGTMSEVTVPADSYFVLGDNREVSNDSRNAALGFVGKDQLRGKVIFRIFPLSEFRTF